MHRSLQVFTTFLKLGLTSFGGPIAHVAYFRKELVAHQQWVTESQFTALFAICQFLPGPASSQLGFALGLLRAGWLGALAAFIAFTLPSALLLIAFASALPFLSTETGLSIVHGLKLVAFVVVADAIWGMFQKLCKDLLTRCIMLAALITMLLVHHSWAQLLVIIGGAILGGLFYTKAVSQKKVRIVVSYGKAWSLCMLALFCLLLAIAIIPTALPHIEVAQVFYRAGALVFGGGHVVLPLLEEAVVGTGMVSPHDFLAGYGATQAMPGPMFSFSAYLGAIILQSTHVNWANACIALLTIFLPGFLLISAILPFWQNISKSQLALKAIIGINAAVVGLLCAALYDPIFTSSIHSVDDLLMGAVGLMMLMIWRLSPLWVIAYCVLGSVFITYI